MGKRIFRPAVESDIKAVSEIYRKIHDAEEAGKFTIGWERGVYPEEDTALESLERGDLFVCEEDGKVTASAIINRVQVDVYEGADWKYEASDDQIMVLHTLVVDPDEGRNGTGSGFVKFYEDYAKEQGSTVLRMDTNERNSAARAMYAKLGYSEIGVAPCVFNGIEGVRLVLMEKSLK